MITLTSVKGNINKDENLHEAYHKLSQKGLCEKIRISRLESQRVRMRKETDKGTDVGLVLPQGMALKNGDVVYLSEDKIIIVAIEPESVAAIRLENDDSHDYELFWLAVRLGHSLGNLHRPIRVVESTVYVPIQADSEIDLLEKLLKPLNHRLEIEKEMVVFEPEGETHAHEHQ